MSTHQSKELPCKQCLTFVICKDVYKTKYKESLKYFGTEMSNVHARCKLYERCELIKQWVDSTQPISECDIIEEFDNEFVIVSRTLLGDEYD